MTPVKIVHDSSTIKTRVFSLQCAFEWKNCNGINVLVDMFFSSITERERSVEELKMMKENEQIKEEKRKKRNERCWDTGQSLWATERSPNSGRTAMRKEEEEEEMKKGGHMADQLAAVGKFIGKAISWMHVDVFQRLIFMLSAVNLCTNNYVGTFRNCVNAPFIDQRDGWKRKKKPHYFVNLTCTKCAEGKQMLFFINQMDSDSTAVKAKGKQEKKTS